MSDQFMRVVDPTAAETVTVPAQPTPFEISENFLTSRVAIGSFGILQFDSMLIRVDPCGTLRRRIAAALNADPTMAADIQRAAFSPAVKR